MIETARFAGSGESFRSEVCVPFLLQAQNADGGWGFHPLSPSRVEPTSWAVCALGSEDSAAGAAATGRGAAWLSAQQLPEGCWAPAPRGAGGAWATSLAGLALEAWGADPAAAARAANWICAAWPQERSWRWRLRVRLMPQPTLVRQDHSLCGWSWTQGTSSWVEPTALALLLLQRVPAPAAPALAERRRRLGEALLYDRMCPGGGWNCGNPMVYGVAGEPQVGPTAWALLALRSQRDRAENQQSLAWLQRATEAIRSPGSLALASLCQQAYGTGAADGARLAERYGANQFLHNTCVFAWAALALGPRPAWIG